MLKFVMFASALCFICGCAHHAPLGNFANNPAAIDRVMAEDAVEQIMALYPPAKTRFELKQPTPDAFGMELASGLRKQGYALMEYHRDETTTAAMPLRYLLDKTGNEPSLCRLTIMIGDQSLARPYRAQNSTIVPAGYWARKE